MSKSSRGKRPSLAGRTAASLAAVLALAGSAGCASGTSSSAGSTATSAAPTAPVGSSPSPSPVETPLSDAVLRSALLTAKDLKSTFTKQSDSGDDGTVSGCPALARLMNTQSVPHQVNADYKSGSTGPWLGESLTGGTAPVLRGYDTRLSQALTSCRSITIASGGTGLTFALTPVHLGDTRATAERMVGSYRGVTLSGYLAFERLPRAILAYHYFGIGSLSSERAAAHLTQALTKARRVLDAPSTASAAAAG